VQWNSHVIKKLSNTAIGEDAMLGEQKENIRISGEISGTKRPKRDSTEEEEEN
jgi:hypothetical protein